ncbi:MAG: acyltransferase [Firmicutes bacterium]|nr:acyltransferase [Bacillota bacterium]
MLLQFAILFYHMGQNCHIGNNVEISRRHYLDGTLKIGNYVNFAHNVYLDYSGDVVIDDHAVLTDGVHILTHDHRFQHEAKTKYDFDDDAIKGNLEICYGAMIGTKSIITPTCHRIGRFSRVGAGAVVTHDVPDYAVVAGAPAKVIRYLEHSLDER